MANAKVIIAGQNNIGPAIKSAQSDISSLSNVVQKAGDSPKRHQVSLLSPPALAAVEQEFQTQPYSFVLILLPRFRWELSQYQKKLDSVIQAL